MITARTESALQIQGHGGKGCEMSQCQMSMQNLMKAATVHVWINQSAGSADCQRIQQCT